MMQELNSTNGFYDVSTLCPRASVNIMRDLMTHGNILKVQVLGWISLPLIHAWCTMMFAHGCRRKWIFRCNVLTTFVSWQIFPCRIFGTTRLLQSGIMMSRMWSHQILAVSHGRSTYMTMQQCCSITCSSSRRRRYKKCEENIIYVMKRGSWFNGRSFIGRECVKYVALPPITCYVRYSMHGLPRSRHVRMPDGRTYVTSHMHGIGINMNNGHVSLRSRFAKMTRTTTRVSWLTLLKPMRTKDWSVYGETSKASYPKCARKRPATFAVVDQQLMTFGITSTHWKLENPSSMRLFYTNVRCGNNKLRMTHRLSSRWASSLHASTLNNKCFANILRKLRELIKYKAWHCAKPFKIIQSHSIPCSSRHGPQERSQCNSKVVSSTVSPKRPAGVLGMPKQRTCVESCYWMGWVKVTTPLSDRIWCDGPHREGFQRSLAGTRGNKLFLQHSLSVQSPK